VGSVPYLMYLTNFTWLYSVVFDMFLFELIIYKLSNGRVQSFRSQLIAFHISSVKILWLKSDLKTCYLIFSEISCLKIWVLRLCEVENYTSKYTVCPGSVRTHFFYFFFLFCPTMPSVDELWH
jgi:hypothetical protein